METMSTTFNSQNKLILNLLKTYFLKDNYANLDKVIPIINGHADISLRLIDWFVTNYAKKNFITYNNNNKRFAVYLEYKLKLKSYKKRRFDPFCRWDRVSIPYKNGNHVLTTIGQLNFFQWAIQNNILSYIRENKELIDNDMNVRNNISHKNKNKKDSNNKTVRKKRGELSISAIKTIKKENVEIIVKFD